MLRWFVLAFAVILLLLTGLLFLARQRDAVNSALLAIVSAAGDEQGVYIIHSDGSGRRRLPNVSGDISSVRWSPDGAWLVLAVDNHLYRIRPDGTGLARISTFPVTTAVWSPDGEWIVFVTYLDGDQEIYRMRPDGQDLQRLTWNARLADTMPAWSPDGEWIVFVVSNFEINQLYRMRADGSDKQRLYETHWVTNTAPVWSPDGEWIVFVSDADSLGDFYRIPVDGSRTAEPFLPGLPDEVVQVVSLSFSTDGGWVTMTALVDDGTFQIYKSRADGSELVRLTHDGDFNGYGAWSPPVDLPWRTWINAAAGLALLGVGIIPGNRISNRSRAAS